MTVVLAAVIAQIGRYDACRASILSRETLLADVPGLDSLRTMETVALVEQHFGVEVDTGRLETLATVGDIVDAVSAALAAAG